MDTSLPVRGKRTSSEVRSSDRNFESIVSEWLEDEAVFDQEDNSDSDSFGTENYESTSSSLTSEGSSDESDERSYRSANFLIGRDGTQWSKTPPPMSRIRAHNVMKIPPGPVKGTVTVSPKDAWDYFISQRMLDEIVHCTNLEGRRIASIMKKNWHNVTCEEMNAFFGLLILAGVGRNWDVSIRELFHDSFANPTYVATFSVNRFEDIRRALRFDDKRTREARSKSDNMALFRYIWELFIENCRQRMHPNETMTIDEQLVPFRGRCKFIQYIPSKPGKYGIKIFWLCDSLTSYATDGLVYTGKDPNQTRQMNVASTTVKTLTKTLRGTATNITMDNFFTSVPLFEELLKDKITAVGTLRQNKKEIPQEMKASKSREVFSSSFGFKDDLTIVSYVPKKNKSVILLSSLHHSAAVEEGRKKKPEIVLFYNQTKSGVDSLDQKTRTYTCKRQSRRWPFVLWTNVMDVAAINALCLFTQQHPHYHEGRSDKRRLFLKELGQELIHPHMENRVNNPRLQKSVLQAMARCGVTRQQPVVQEIGISPKRRCFMCPHRLDRKTSQTCYKCAKNICKEHSTVVCKDCFL